MSKVTLKFTRIREEETFVEVEVSDPPLQGREAETSAEDILHYNWCGRIEQEGRKKAELPEAVWSFTKLHTAEFKPAEWVKEKDDENPTCVCGHPYHRHFDTYESMRPVSCKYCSCFLFLPKSEVMEQTNTPKE